MIGTLALLVLSGTDFPVCTAPSFQDHSVVRYVNGCYYVFWCDERFYSSTHLYAVYGARVTADGHVIDPDGKLIFCDSVNTRFGVAFGSSEFLAVCRNGC